MALNEIVALVTVVINLGGFYVILRNLPLQQRQLSASAELTSAEVESKRLSNYDTLWNELRERDKQLIEMDRQLRDLIRSVNDLDSQVVIGRKEVEELKEQLRQESAAHAETRQQLNDERKLRQKLEAQLNELNRKWNKEYPK